MRKSEAAKYARWSAAAALVLTGLTVSVYLKRGYTRYLEIKKAPAAAPVDVERQSSLLTFSKVEENRTIFTVEASKSIDFKSLNASDLEGVKITIFGKEGARHDTMETHTCRYTKDSGDVVCSGDVEITLMSAEEWKAAGKSGGAGAGVMKVETKGMAFNRASGEAKTDAEVRFTFANGSGRAVGAEYHSEEGTLRLQRDVKMKLVPPANPSARGAHLSAKPGGNQEPVEVSGSRMDFSRDAGTIYLSGPAEAKTLTQRLTSAGMLLELDGNLHAKRLIAKSNGQGLRPEFHAQQGAGKQSIAADEIAASFAPEGWLTHAEANGNVSGQAEKGEEIQNVKANYALLELVAGQNAPKQLVLKGAVDARSNTAEKGVPGGSVDTRRLTTEELQLDFAEPKNGAGTQLVAAHTPTRGLVEWNDSTGASAKPSQTVVQADALGVKFTPSGRASRLDAQGNVQTERRVTGSDKQTATAKNGFVELQPAGGWRRMELNDDVKMNEGQRAAQADHAVFERAEQTVTLTGRASVRDAASITSAPKLSFRQATGELSGEGGVRSSDLSSRSGTVHLAPVAANVSAEKLSGNSKTGRALYTGHARLWQGDSVLEADSIELLKNERKANAVGNVRAVFPQAGNGKPGPNATATAAKQPALWHAQSAKMTYWDQENRARLERNVVVQSGDEKIGSDTLELFFVRANSANGASAQTPGANGVPGAQQISRAVGTGNVMVQQGGRRATAERGEYTAADGKFVMTGGTPTLFDASEGTTTGRQLTFFLADATIIVDSENGSRTLTKHRVEK